MADMSDMLKNFASMMDGKEIPDNIKEILSSFSKEKNNNSGKEILQLLHLFLYS